MINVHGMNLCENCFEPMNGGRFCTKCGYSSEMTVTDPTMLRPGSVLLGKYLVGKVIGKGGFGITYLAYDNNTGKKVAIKEYYPYGVAIRVAGASTVNVTSEENETAFRLGAEKFYNEAKLVSKFNGNPNIVGVYEFFYENDTVYFSMEYLKGMSLKEYIDKNGLLTPGQALHLMKNAANALMAAHSANVLHRDISPDNIIICDNGDIKLIDFGAARQVVAEHSQSFSVILKPGFAPLEQYQKKGNQGPWTDIYALGATIYYTLTGDIPEDPMTRLDDDAAFQSNEFAINDELWKIISTATKLKIEDRYGDVFRLINDLNSVSFKPEPLVAPSEKQEEMPQFRTASVYKAGQKSPPVQGIQGAPQQVAPQQVAQQAAQRQAVPPQQVPQQVPPQQVVRQNLQPNMAGAQRLPQQNIVPQQGVQQVPQQVAPQQAAPQQAAQRQAVPPQQVPQQVPPQQVVQQNLQPNMAGAQRLPQQGASQPVAPQNNMQQPVQPNYMGQMSPQMPMVAAPQKKKKTWIWVLIAVIGVVSILVAIFVPIFSGANQTSKDRVEPSDTDLPVAESSIKPQSSSAPQSSSKPQSSEEFVRNKEIYTSEHETFYYTGTLVDGVPDGSGYALAEGGSWTYSGEWKKGLFSGTGTFSCYPYSGYLSCILSGEWKNDYMNGSGEYTEFYDDGHETIREYRKGEFVDSVLNCSDGTIIHYDTNGAKSDEYHGECKDDSANGSGEYKKYYEGGKTISIYRKGEFVDGELNCSDGTLMYYDTDGIKSKEYHGECKYSIPNGYGTSSAYDKNGNCTSKYVGEWANGKVNGQGIYYDENGNVLHSGTWKDGEFVG